MFIPPPSSPTQPLFSPVGLRLQRASHSWAPSLESLGCISRKFLLQEQGPREEQPCSRFYSIPGRKCTRSGLLSVCWTVSPSPGFRGERGRCRQAPTHLFCVLWPPHRKQELANSSDVPLPDRSLSPPLTAPPTMKVRGLELVSGEGWGGGASQGSALVRHLAQLRLPSEGMGCPASSGSSVHLSSAAREGGKCD